MKYNIEEINEIGKILAEVVEEAIQTEGQVDGAVLTAKARSAWMSGNWQKLVSARSLLPLAA